MLAHQPTTFKLFWAVVAVFASINTLLVAAADSSVPSFTLGGLPGNNELVHNQVYNLTWGGSINATAISFYVAQFPDPKANATQPTEHYTLAKNTTDNPFKWNVTMPVGSNLALSAFPDAGNRVNTDFLNLRVVSAKASSAIKLSMARFGTKQRQEEKRSWQGYVDEGGVCRLQEL
ncbi:hypothetical protein QFC24_007038 [Naganishia onofrii]|uniref:Uncharacterized protein n=1 Tax=Naganishia onofrii TaxID=1851511 RepID=A0ACC2WU78_9TREE|nr:hypothetical protein QFC24_007038 [Naganishia onofrii]